MGLVFSSATAKTDTATQTDETGSTKRRNFKFAARLASSNALNAARKSTVNNPPAPTFPEEMLQFSSEEIDEMILLYKEKKNAIDRTSIRGVRSKKDLYDSLGDKAEQNKPKSNLLNLHRQNHPKGYLTKITNDYHAQHDEELTVHKGTMVKVLRNHCDGRYEIYSAGGFGLVPGKVLAYVQYEPDADGAHL